MTKWFSLLFCLFSAFELSAAELDYSALFGTARPPEENRKISTLKQLPGEMRALMVEKEMSSEYRPNLLVIDLNVIAGNSFSQAKGASLEVVSGAGQKPFVFTRKYFQKQDPALVLDEIMLKVGAYSGETLVLLVTDLPLELAHESLQEFLNSNCGEKLADAWSEFLEGREELFLDVVEGADIEFSEGVLFSCGQDPLTPVAQLVDIFNFQDRRRQERAYEESLPLLPGDNSNRRMVFLAENYQRHVLSKRIGALVYVSTNSFFADRFKRVQDLIRGGDKPSLTIFDFHAPSVYKGRRGSNKRGRR